MNKTKTGGVIAGVIMVLVVILFVLNIKVIPAGYVGVQYNINKGVEEKVLGQGWHLVSPTVKVKTYTVGLEQSYLTKKKKGDSRKDERMKAFLRARLKERLFRSILHIRISSRAIK